MLTCTVVHEKFTLLPSNMLHLIFVVPELLIKFNHNIVLINAMRANGII